MIPVFIRRSFRASLVVLIFVAACVAPGALSARQAEPKPAQVEEPRYREYRGVRLGLTADEVHSALGTPKDSDARQEFFAVSDEEMAQVFYDARRTVWAVNVSYLGGKVPTPEQLFGAPVEAKPDGSVYKMVKYERAGYLVAYSRDAGDAPLVTVVMQRLPK